MTFGVCWKWAQYGTQVIERNKVRQIYRHTDRGTEIKYYLSIVCTSDTLDILSELNVFPLSFSETSLSINQLPFISVTGETYVNADKER